MSVEPEHPPLSQPVMSINDQLDASYDEGYSDGFHDGRVMYEGGILAKYGFIVGGVVASVIVYLVSWGI